MVKVKYCDLFEFECPQKWSSLKTSESRDTRFCEVCAKNVYLCRTDSEYHAHRSKGDCVAVDVKRPGDSRPRRLAGMPPRPTK